VGHGKVICFSIYCGPEFDFGNGPKVWVDTMRSPGLSFVTASRTHLLPSSENNEDIEHVTQMCSMCLRSTSKVPTYWRYGTTTVLITTCWQITGSFVKVSTTMTEMTTKHDITSALCTMLSPSAIEQTSRLWRRHTSYGSTLWCVSNDVWRIFSRGLYWSFHWLVFGALKYLFRHCRNITWGRTTRRYQWMTSLEDTKSRKTAPRYLLTPYIDLPIHLSSLHFIWFE